MKGNRNSRREKRILPLILGILLLSLFLCGAGLILRSGEKQGPISNLDSLNEENSMVLVTGANYNLSKPEDQILEELKEEQPNEALPDNTDDAPAEPKTETPTETQTEAPTETETQTQTQGQGQGDNSLAAQVQDEGTSGEEVESPIPELSLSPIIISSLSDGYQYSYTDISFTVEGIDYKNNHIDSFNYKVLLDGNMLYSTGMDGGAYTYRNPEPLSDGAHEVSIIIVDDEGHSASRTYSVNIDTNQIPDIEEYATLVVEARSIGRGTILSTTERITPGESGGSFVDRVLRDYGFSPSSSGGIYSYYLGRISYPGISEGAYIPDALSEYVGDLDLATIDSNSLGERDFAPGSGWIYLYNYQYMGYGLSGITLNDGDEIILCFTLNMGFEYDGTWTSYGAW